MRYVVRNTLTGAVLAVQLMSTEATEIHVARGALQDYYHVSFVLTPQNRELSVPLSERKPKYKKSNEYSFAEGGQFEVFVRKAAFPIPAPHTEREFLILRMPWTNPSDVHAESQISAKRELFDRIQQMKAGTTDHVEVTVELNPYVTVISKNPLSLELSGRNIFFRHAHGRYIDYVGPLKKEDGNTGPVTVRHHEPNGRR